MKAYKSCYWRFLGRHQFKIISEKTRLNIIPPQFRGDVGSHYYERQCERCGLHQKISTTMGLHFLEKEEGGK